MATYTRTCSHSTEDYRRELAKIPGLTPEVLTEFSRRLTDAAMDAQYRAAREVLRHFKSGRRGPETLLAVEPTRRRRLVHDLALLGVC